MCQGRRNRVNAQIIWQRTFFKTFFFSEVRPNLAKKQVYPLCIIRISVTGIYVDIFWQFCIAYQFNTFKNDCKLD